MRTLNRSLITVYLLVATFFVLLFISEEFNFNFPIIKNLAPLVNSHSGEVITLWLIMPVSLLLGCAAYITSYKAILVKLLPLLLILGVMKLELVQCSSCGESLGLAFAVAVGITFIYAIVLLIIVTIARFFQKKRQL